MPWTHPRFIEKANTPCRKFRWFCTVIVATAARRTLADAGDAYVTHLEHVMERKRTTIQDYRGYLRRHLVLIIGRDKATGAPLGKRREEDDPGFAADRDGTLVPLDAHMRLARPRTPQTEDSRILRRGFNYSRGIDGAGQLDMGLVFVAFNRDVERQFATVQRRLAGEALTDYVVPTGGGYFHVPPGVADGQDWVGSRLFA